MHDDLSGLGEDLKKADKEVVCEIVRAAELFLGSQLTAGVAADQRAVTFASVLAAAVAILIGGFVAIETGDNPTPGLGWVIGPVVLCLLVSIVFAVAACRPTDWCYPGNNPRLWREEAKEKVPLRDALADQAEQYAIGIHANRDVLDKNARLMNWAFGWSGAALIIGSVTAIYFTA